MPRICFVRYWLPLIGLVLLAAGCGSGGPATYPVNGKVVYQDGTPMKKGLVEFEALEGEWQGRNARGVIQEDGSFLLTTGKLGDGAVAGRHRAIVRQPYPDVDLLEGERMPPPMIDPKFGRYETSGLEFTVKEQENDIVITVQKPGAQ